MGKVDSQTDLLYGRDVAAGKRVKGEMRMVRCEWGNENGEV